MNASEIEDALRSNRFAREYLVGVFAADQLPTKEFPGAYIVNTDTSLQPGQHFLQPRRVQSALTALVKIRQLIRNTLQSGSRTIFRSFNVRRSSRGTLRFADNTASISSYLGPMVSRMKT